MAEVIYDNAIYEDMNTAENDYFDTSVDMMKNECYGEVKKPASNVFAVNPSENDYVDAKKDDCPREVTTLTRNTSTPVVKSSSRKIVGLTVAFITLVLLLMGAVAASGYALLEISKIKSDMASSSQVAIQQQNAGFTSKLNTVSQQMNASIEILKQQLILEVQKLQNASHSTAERVTTLEEVSEMNETMKIYQQLIRDMLSFSSELQQLQASTREQYENATQKYFTLDSKVSQIETFSNEQYSTLDTGLQQLQNLTSEKHENVTRQLNEQIERESSTLDFRINTGLQQLQNSTKKQFENATQQLVDRIMQIEALHNQQYSTLDSRINQTQALTSTEVQLLQDSIAEQHKNLTRELEDWALQIELTTNQQYSNLDSSLHSGLKQLENLTAVQYENASQQLDDRIMQIEAYHNEQYSTLDSRINLTQSASKQQYSRLSIQLQQVQNLTTEQYENATLQLEDQIMQLQATSSQQYYTLDSRISQVQTFSSQLNNTLSSRIDQVETSSAQQNSTLNSRIDSVETTSNQQNASLNFRIDHIEIASNQQSTSLSSRIDHVESSSIQQNSTLNSRISEVESSSQAAIQASIAILKQQSTINDSTLDARISDITFCGKTPGWRRVGYLDMTDPSQSCPSGLALKYYSPGLRSCGRVTNDSVGCWSTFYSTGSAQYSRVCGRVRGYQFGVAGAFRTSGVGINSYYVDGVSLTHGQSGRRTHIWTFAAGLTEEIGSAFSNFECPCTTNSAIQPPTFVRYNDYFCESGINAAWTNSYSSMFFPNDPLWDGQNCIGSCCEFNNPPYFIKTLTSSTTDDIELRICSGYQSGSYYGDFPIDLLELYVQ